MTEDKRPEAHTLWHFRHAASNLYFELAGLGRALLDRFSPTLAERLVVLDDVFPRLTTGFRVAEFNAILNRFEHAVVYTTNHQRSTFAEYSAAYPGLGGRVQRLHRLSPLRGSAAYLVFLNNAFSYLEQLEKVRLPVVFELYPGGGFRLDDPDSDRKLQRIFASRQFYKVLVTQTVTYNYLLAKGFCRKDQILFVYGAVVPPQMLVDTAHLHSRYGIHKEGVDICFAAFKYMPRGSDKGYDQFIAAARILSDRYPMAHFHVIGNFDANDCELGNLRSHLTFYGPQPSPFFAHFYSRMDLIISPNIPFVLAPGAFDGFPTACCMEAALCATAMFVTDELKLNENRLENGLECVIIPPQAEQIAELVGEYLENPARLASLGEHGQRAMRRLLATDLQMEPRLQLLEDAMNSRQAGGRSRRTESLETSSATESPRLERGRR